MIHDPLNIYRYIRPVDIYIYIEEWNKWFMIQYDPHIYMIHERKRDEADKSDLRTYGHGPGPEDSVSPPRLPRYSLKWPIDKDLYMIFDDLPIEIMKHDIK